MARRTLNRHELRAAAEAAEARGLKQPNARPPADTGSAAPSARKTATGARMRVVWAVCDIGGRTVATFEYPKKAEAEARAAQLQAQGKGKHFVRTIKEPMPTTD